MKVKALICFSGVVSMYKGEEREINDSDILTDLINANYIEPIDLPTPPVIKSAIEPVTDPPVYEKPVDSPTPPVKPKKPNKGKDKGAKK